GRLHQVEEVAGRAGGGGLDENGLAGVDGAEAPVRISRERAGASAAILPISDTCRIWRVPPRWEVPTSMREPFFHSRQVALSARIGTKDLISDSRGSYADLPLSGFLDASARVPSVNPTRVV